MWTRPSGTLESVLGEGVELAVQPRPNGTGGAVVAAVAQLDSAGSNDNDGAPVVVLSGDVPLVSAETIEELVRRTRAERRRGRDDGEHGIGRSERLRAGGARRAGRCERVVETKAAGDATPEQLEIREVNTGVYVFSPDALREALGRLSAENAQGELYLPQALAEIRSGGGTVAAHTVADERLVLGVNDRAALARVRGLAQEAIHARHMMAGVSIVDPQATVIDVDVQIGRDTTIEPFTTIRGSHPDRRGLRREAFLSDRLRARGRRHASGRSRYLRPGHHPARGREGGDVRGGQELRCGRGARSRTCPTSATPTWARAPTSAPARSPPTTTGATSTARGSKARAQQRARLVRGAGEHRR